MEGGPVQGQQAEIVVKGTCKLCTQQVWNNQERWKSRTDDGAEDGYYIHKACYDRLHNPETALAPVQKTVSTRLRDDSVGATSVLEHYMARVQRGDMVTRIKSGALFGKREEERYVAVCPHTSHVHWFKPPVECTGEPLAAAGGVAGVAAFESWIQKLGEHKRDVLVGVLPATARVSQCAHHHSVSSHARTRTRTRAHTPRAHTHTHHTHSTSRRSWRNTSIGLWSW